MGSVNILMQQGTETRNWLVVALVAVVLTVAAYVNVLDGEMVFDDRPFLMENPQLGESHSLGYFFSKNVWSYSHNPDAHLPTRYRPLFFASIWVIDSLWPDSVFALHVFNVCLHIVAVLLLLAALTRFLPGISPLAACIGTCLFAVHPVNSEAVAWISAFVHPMAAVFLLTSFLLHDSYRNSQKLPQLLGAGLCFVLALLSNEMAIGYPLFIFMYDWVRGGKIRILYSSPYLILLITYFVVRTIILGKSVPIILNDQQLWLLFPAFLADHIRYLVLPWPQPLYLAMPTGWGLPILSVSIAMLFTGLILYFVLRKILDRRGLLIATAWIIAFLMPPLAAVFNPQAVFVLRSLYVPSIGIAIMLAWAVGSVPVLQRKAGLTVIAAGLLLAFGLTLTANRYWHDDGHVYRRITTWNPDQFSGFLGLAEHLAREGKTVEAIQMYEKSIALAATNSKPEPLMRLGLLLGESGNSDSSLSVFKQITMLQPNNSEAWVGVGNNLWFLNRLEEALVAYKKAHVADHNNQIACHNLVLVLEKMGKPEEANRYTACAEEIP